MGKVDERSAKAKIQVLGSSGCRNWFEVIQCNEQDNPMITEYDHPRIPELRLL